MIEEITAKKIHRFTAGKAMKRWINFEDESRWFANSLTSKTNN
jgi:hypothetical protein